MTILADATETVLCRMLLHPFAHSSQLVDTCSRSSQACSHSAAGCGTRHRLQVRQVAEENGVDVSNQIKELEERAKQVGSR